MIAYGIQQTFYPSMSFEGIGPFSPSFEAQADSTRSLDVLIRICGGLYLIIGCILFTVRWNTVNGKLSGFACLGCGANIANVTFKGLDAGVFVARPLYLHAAVLCLGGVHLMFKSNPVIKTDKSK